MHKYIQPQEYYEWIKNSSYRIATARRLSFGMNRAARRGWGRRIFAFSLKHNNKTNNVYSNSACIVYLYDNVNLQIYNVCVIKESSIWHRMNAMKPKHTWGASGIMLVILWSQTLEKHAPQPRWINTTTLHLHIPNSKCNPKHHTR